MQLSPNFSLAEFDVGGSAVPDNCIPAFKTLCVGILEPMRLWADASLIITSGYRSPDANTAAHGQSNSEHMAMPDWCACDFVVQDNPARPLFDWARNNPQLPFHQLILEHGQNSTVIHVSWNRLKPGVRSVLEGATHNAEPYTKVDYVPFLPDPTSHDAVQEAAAEE